MKINVKLLLNKNRKSRRANHNKYNYTNYDNIRKLDFEEITNKYVSVECLKNSKLYQAKTDSDVNLIEFDGMKVLLRDKPEKRFFLNGFIDEYIEYNETNETNLSLKDYIINISNFLIIKDYDIVVLDIEKDYI